jgi:hypothetical protein
MWLLDSQTQLAAGPGDNAPGAPAFVRKPAAERPRRGAVREMLAALEHATVAGQHHLMRKVLVLLDEEVSSSSRSLQDGQRRAIAATLAALGREVERIAPDGVTFTRGATEIVDALAAVA